MKVIILVGILMSGILNSSPAGKKIARSHQDYPTNFLQGEFLLDTGVVSIPGIGEQRQPAVAFDGTNYLVAWTDYRNGEPVICASRVDQDGNCLDDEIFMPYSGGYQCAPAIAFDGTNYLVIWMEKNCRFGYYSNICGARVNIYGSVIDTMPIIINHHARGKPMVIFVGGIFFIVWVSNEWDWRISGTRVTTSGIVLDTAGVDYGGGMNPSVASSGNNFLIVTKRGNSNWGFDIMGYLINFNGSLLDSTKICTLPSMFWYPQTYIYSPRISFDGTNYFVIWDSRDTTFTNYDSNIWGARVSQEGVLIDTNSILITNNDAGQFCPALVYNGRNYLAIWIDRRNQMPESYNIYGTRVDPSGIVLDPNGVCISNQPCIQSNPTVVTSNGGFLVAWQDQQYSGLGSTDIKAARVASTGLVIDPNGIPIRKSNPGRQMSPSVAFDGTNFMAVWQDCRNASLPTMRSEIYGIRVSETGNILDTSAIPISALSGDTSSLSEFINPEICNGGSRYLVTYIKISGAGSIKGVFINPSGSVSNAINIPLNWMNYENDLAFGDTIFLIVWSDLSPTGVRGCRITQSGTILDPNGFMIDAFYDWLFDHTVIYGDSNFLVVWKLINGVRAKRVAVDGSVLDPQPIHLPYLNDLSAAFDGNNYFIVGTGWRNEQTGIYGYRVNQSGVLLDSNMIPVAVTTCDEIEPTVGFDGTNFIVVWSAFYDSVSYDLYSAKVTPQGQVQNIHRIVYQPGDQCGPVLARGNSNQMLLAYSGWTPYINSHPASTQRIWGKMYPFTGLQETPDANKVELDFFTSSPNPFRNRTEIRFNTGKESDNSGVTLKIFDVTGRLVKSIGSSSIVSRPSSFVNWDGTDQSGRKVSAGIYFVRLTAPDRELIQKIVLLK